MSEWIKTKEQLPEEGVPVLCIYWEGGIRKLCVGRLWVSGDKHGWTNDWKSFEPKYWTSLPENLPNYY